MSGFASRAAARRANGNVMTVDSKGRDIFIVDNSVSGWTGLRYLEEWSSIASAVAVSTLTADIGPYAACRAILTDCWEKLHRGTPHAQ